MWLYILSFASPLGIATIDRLYDEKIAGKTCFRRAARIAGINIQTICISQGACGCKVPQSRTFCCPELDSFRESTVPLDGLLGSVRARALEKQRRILKTLFLLQSISSEYKALKAISFRHPHAIYYLLLYRVAAQAF